MIIIFFLLSENKNTCYVIKKFSEIEMFERVIKSTLLLCNCNFQHGLEGAFTVSALYYTWKGFLGVVAWFSNDCNLCLRWKTPTCMPSKWWHPPCRRNNLTSRTKITKISHNETWVCAWIQCNVICNDMLGNAFRNSTLCPN